MWAHVATIIESKDNDETTVLHTMVDLVDMVKRDKQDESILVHSPDRLVTAARLGSSMRVMVAGDKLTGHVVQWLAWHILTAVHPATKAMVLAQPLKAPEFNMRSNLPI